MRKFKSAVVVIALLVMTLAFAAGVGSADPVVSQEVAIGIGEPGLGGEGECVPAPVNSKVDPSQVCECPDHPVGTICIIVHYFD